jgi:hypothetical protein
LIARPDVDHPGHKGSQKGALKNQLQQNPQIALITQIFETLDELGPTV